MNVWIKRSLGTAAVAGGLLFAGAAVASASTGTGHTESAGSTALSSPIELGSVDLGLTSESSSKHTSTVTHSDRKGTEKTTKTSESGRKDSVGLSTGTIKADPAATLKSVTRSDLTKTSGHRSDSSAKGSAKQHTSGSLQAPISIGGAKLTTEHEDRSATSKKTTKTGKHGTSTSEQSSKKSSKTGTAVGVGKLTVNPNGSFDSHKSVAGWFDSDGAGVAGSASDTKVQGSAPISFGGLTVQGSREDASSQYRKETVTDRRGTSTSEHSSERASKTGAGLAVGRFTADPKAVLTDRRRSLVATDGEDSFLGSNSGDTSAKLAAPFHFEGVGGYVARSDPAKTTDREAYADRRGSVSRTVTKESASHQAIAGQSGAVKGHPALGLTDRRNDLFATDGEDTVVRSDRKSVLHSAFPYSSDGFALAGDFGSASAKTVTEKVSDHHGTTTRTESDEQAQRTQPAYAFDGFRGHPAGNFDLAELTSLTKHLKH